MQKSFKKLCITYALMATSALLSIDQAINRLANGLDILRKVTDPGSLQPEEALLWGLEEYKKKNYKEAEKYLLVSASQDNTKAMYNLGNVYGEMALFNQDSDYKKARKLYFSKAQEWHEKAAAKGSVSAMKKLGRLYFEGAIGSSNDDSDSDSDDSSDSDSDDKSHYNKAKEWYEKAAAEGDIDAMYEVGWLYDRFLDDNNKAKEWYEKAAVLGNDHAMTSLADMYFIRNPMLHTPHYKPDYNKAKMWYEKAAAQGNFFGMIGLSNMYAGGYIGKKNNEPDLETADFWRKKAQEVGGWQTKQKD